VKPSGLNPLSDGAFINPQEFRRLITGKNHFFHWLSPGNKKPAEAGCIRC